MIKTLRAFQSDRIQIPTLQPRPTITLVGTGAGYEQVAEEFGCKIIPDLDMNFIGMPLAGSLIDIAMRV